MSFGYGKNSCLKSNGRYFVDNWSSSIFNATRARNGVDLFCVGLAVVVVSGSGTPCMHIDIFRGWEWGYEAKCVRELSSKEPNSLESTHNRNIVSICYQQYCGYQLNSCCLFIFLCIFCLFPSVLLFNMYRESATNFFPLTGFTYVLRSFTKKNLVSEASLRGQKHQNCNGVVFVCSLIHRQHSCYKTVTKMSWRGKVNDRWIC